MRCGGGDPTRENFAFERPEDNQPELNYSPSQPPACQIGGINYLFTVDMRGTAPVANHTLADFEDVP